MRKRTLANKPAIRYSEAFKMAVVRELESSGEPFDHLRRKYGLGVSTVQVWTRKYGNGTRGKVIRVDTPKEIDENKGLKEGVRRLESALADSNVELALERAYTQLACQRAGIKEVEEFKKKADGQPPIRP